MVSHLESAVEKYKELTGLEKLRKVPIPFCPEGSLHPKDDEESGQLAGKACSQLMTNLWLARLSRPDIIKPICDLATNVQCWTVNCDKQLHRLICYLDSSRDFKLTGYVNDDPKELELRLFVDADFAGDSGNARSTSGGYLVFWGPRTYYPPMWLSRRQTSTSRSTTEAEIVSLAACLFSEALPTMQLWDELLGRGIKLRIMEDNEATIKVPKKGYSAKLSNVLRTHKVNISSIKEVLDNDIVDIEHVKAEFQAADIFTKALAPQKWANALNLLGINYNSSFADERGKVSLAGG